MVQQSQSEISVSIVIPAYYRSELLTKEVRSAISQDMPAEHYEVIVVDSSDDDDNRQIVESLRAVANCDLLYVKKSPEGPGPSRNLGAERARGRYLAFMDSDCQASREWLQAGVAEFDDRTGLVQGKTIPEPGVPYSIFNRSFQIDSENFIYEALNIFYRRDVFLELGGFFAAPDAAAMSVLGGEDVDLAWKTKRAGWQSRFAERAVVAHVVERMTVWQWFCDRRLMVVPRITRDYPETRQFFFARYFYSDAQAYLLMAIGSALLSLKFPFALVGLLPYVILRGSEPTRALPGILRPLRVLFYLPKDLVTLVLLLRGCLKFRTLLL